MGKELAITTFGGLLFQLNGCPLTGFHSKKSEAALVYLAVTGQAFTRETLAEFFWPERPLAQALSNLRVVLSNLNQLLPGVLEVTRERVRLSPAAGIWVDAGEFARACAENAPERAAGYYRGDFLSGFYLRDTPEFERWISTRREQYQRELTAGLESLVQSEIRQGQWERALTFAWKLVGCAPLEEKGHALLLQLLSRAGQRAAAVDLAEKYRARLAEQLELTPSPEFDALFEQIRGGSPPDLAGKPSPTGLPPAITDAGAPTADFAGRKAELRRLIAGLERADGSAGQVLLVRGEAGIGKTALLREFERQARAAQPDLAIGCGSFSTFSGSGDPFEAYRGVFQNLLRPAGLAADPFGRGAALLNDGSAHQVARGLLEKLPELAASLDLADDLVPPAPGGGQVEAARQTGGPRSKTGDHQRTFRQVAAFFTALAERFPVLILIDDLQWADPSSLSLLGYLADRMAGSRFLAVAAYRPAAFIPREIKETVSIPQLEREFGRRFGEGVIDLDRVSQLEKEQLVEDILDLAPNRFGTDFRRRMMRLTGGHPLFTLELIRDMRAHGVVTRGSDGSWEEASSISWEELPARVEAVIEMQVERLSAPARAVLRAAGVLGDEFEEGLLGRMLGWDEPHTNAVLNSELVREFNILTALGGRVAAGRWSTRFGFRHSLYQAYFNNALSESERIFYHRRAAEVLTELRTQDGEDRAASAAALAHHWIEARVIERGCDELLLASSRAVKAGAYEDALFFLRRGLGLLPEIPDARVRAEKELALFLALCGPLQTLRGYQDAEVQDTYRRLRELTEDHRTANPTISAMYLLRTSYKTHEERRAVQARAEEVLQAGQAADPLLALVAHWALGSERVYQARLAEARQHLEQVVSGYLPEEYPWCPYLYGNDPGLASRSKLGWTLWLLGYPDQALRACQEVLRLAQAAGNPLVLGFTIGNAGVMFHQMRGEVEAARLWNERSLEHSRKDGLKFFHPSEMISKGWLLARSGQVAEGLELVTSGIQHWKISGAVRHYPHYMGLLGEVMGLAGGLDEALAVIADGITAAAAIDERYFEAELYRLKGSLLSQLGQNRAAEEALSQALEIAKFQGARAWQLRAAIALAELWQAQGRPAQAAALLSTEHGWFTEGFDTPDLQHAARLLRELQQSV